MFQDNSTICFIGDSITADGRWIYELYEFFREKGTRIKLYNCGIPGGTVAETLERMDTDCFNHKPDMVVSMFGLNDINYHLYGDKYYFRVEERENALRVFEESLEKLVKALDLREIKLVLMTPPPYGDFVKSKAENLVHANQGVSEICKILKKTAVEFNVPLIDINSLFEEFKSKLRLINPDRLHPTAPGHHLITQGFLRFFSLVSEIDTEYPTKRSEINNLRYEEEKILRAIIFVEWHILKSLKGSSVKTVKEKAKEELLKYTPGEFFYNQLDTYIKNIDALKKHQELLEEYTKE